MKLVSSFFSFGTVILLLCQIAAAEAFKVGFVLPLTGAAADYGEAIENGVQLAVKDRPELFTDIRFEFEDAAYDTKMAITAFNNLADEKKVSLAVTWGVPFCKALAPIAESRKIPLVGICLDPTIAKDKSYVLRFKNTLDEMMQAQTTYLDNKGVKKIGIIISEHPYLEELNLAFNRNLKPGQTVEVVDNLLNNEMDLRSTIGKLKRKNFDAVGVFLFVGQISVFYKQAHDLKYSATTFGTDFFESLSEAKASEGQMNGAVFSSILIKEPFVKRYKEIYGNESQLAFAAPAYEFAITVGELFNKVALPADEVIKKFSSVGVRDGMASGPYKYVNDKNVGQYFQFPVVMKRVVKDHFENLPQ